MYAPFWPSSASCAYLSEDKGNDHLMWSARTQPDVACISLSRAIPTVWYSVLGVPVAVGSDVEQALQVVDQTYAAFRHAPAAPSSAFEVQLRRLEAEHGY